MIGFTNTENLVLREKYKDMRALARQLQSNLNLVRPGYISKDELAILKEQVKQILTV